MLRSLLVVLCCSYVLGTTKPTRAPSIRPTKAPSMAPSTGSPSTQGTFSPSPPPTTGPPTYPTGHDTAGQVMGALIFIALIVLVIGFGIYGWRRNKFSELTRIDLERGQALDEEEPVEKLKPDEVALAAAVGPTYFEKSQGEDEAKKERKREGDTAEPYVRLSEKPATIHLSPETGKERRASISERRASIGGHERRASSGAQERRGSTGGGDDPFGQIETALANPRISATEEADRQAKHVADLAAYEAHQAERRASFIGGEIPVEEPRASLDQMIMNETEARRRADAAAAAAKQAEEAMERAAEDMRLRQQEELREAERRDAEMAAEARQALLRMEQTREAELRAQEEAENAKREAEEQAEQVRRDLEALAKSEKEAADARALAQQAADLRPAPAAFKSDPFADIDTETEPRSPPLTLPSTTQPVSTQLSEPLSPGEEDAEAALAEAQAALEAAEAEERAMEAALEAERLLAEQEDDVTDLS